MLCSICTSTRINQNPQAFILSPIFFIYSSIWIHSLLNFAITDQLARQRTAEPFGDMFLCYGRSHKLSSWRSEDVNMRRRIPHSEMLNLIPSPCTGAMNLSWYLASSNASHSQGSDWVRAFHFLLRLLHSSHHIPLDSQCAEGYAYAHRRLKVCLAGTYLRSILPILRFAWSGHIISCSTSTWTSGLISPLRWTECQSPFSRSGIIFVSFTLLRLTCLYLGIMLFFFVFIVCVFKLQH